MNSDYSTKKLNIVEHNGMLWFFEFEEGKIPSLVITGKNPEKIPSIFKKGEVTNSGSNTIYKVSYSTENALKLAEIFEKLKPSFFGVESSFGFGYRSPFVIGNLIQAEIAKDYNFPPILAQQSARELSRTGRTFDDVMASAVWSAFGSGFFRQWGADADHLKTNEQIKKGIDAGFTYLTLDPSDFLYKGVDEQKTESYLKKHSNTAISINGKKWSFDKTTVQNFAKIYGAAVDFVKEKIEFIKKYGKNKKFDIEISLDEGEETTSPKHLILFLKELEESGIKPTCIAPRYFGFFEKGIDYYTGIDSEGKKFINEKPLVEQLKNLSDIANHFNFKLGVHSGSDKFSFYPIFRRTVQSKFHLKTAGTTFLEEIFTIGIAKRELFVKIVEHCFENFEEQKKSYSLKTDVKKAYQTFENLKTADDLGFEKLFSDDDIRQIIHVNYGTVLSRFKEEIGEVLLTNYSLLKERLTKHLKAHLDMLFG